MTHSPNSTHRLGQLSRAFALLVLVPLAANANGQGPNEARLLRFPAIHGNTIAFSYGGDLYSVASGGGMARKLTAHAGYEVYPRFSPDGKQLAFTGQYDGNTEVFLMPAMGGEPKRLTYTATLGRDDISDRMGPNNLVMTWKNRSPEVVFRSRMRSFNSFNGSLFSVGIDGGMPAQVPVPRGGFCSFSPDDTKMAYNRVFREYRTWKKYRGGMADDIWVYDFKTRRVENITNDPAQDIIPMWHENRIYFLSERGDESRMNLYVFDLDTKETRRLTNHDTFDIKFPSIGPKAIVYENGGYIYRFDLATEKTTKVAITIADDRLTRRRELTPVAKMVRGASLAPNGKRVVFNARGDVFSVPAKHGPTRNLTGSSDAHDRNAEWSPNGKWITFISDRSGEDEIYVVGQDGRTAARALTRGGDTYLYGIVWSPDSKMILWADRKQRLRFLKGGIDADATSGETQVTEVASASAWEIRQYAWSADGKWIAYAREETDSHGKIYLYSVEKKTTTAITDGWYESASPAFSRDGKFLYFVSSRDFSPIYSATEWNHAYRDMQRIYLVALASDTKSPFEPESDEVEIEGEPTEKDALTPPDEKSAEGGSEADPAGQDEDARRKSDEETEDDEKKKGKKRKKKPVVVKVDLEGIRDRVISLPIDASNYRNVTALADRVYYVRNGSKDEKAHLVLFDLEKKKEVDLGEWRGYELSVDGKKMLVAAKGKFGIVPTPKKKIKLEKPVDLSGLEVRLDRRAEWRQIFAECWRQMRDFFYDPNMHGIDWVAMRKRYEPLVDHVVHRNDLTYVIGEMIGELNVGHAYVGGGDRPAVKRVPMGLLGARLRRDATGYYRIEKILRGENWRKSLRSPLTEMGVGAKDGDFILAIDGEATKDLPNIYAALRNTAGKQVRLRLAAANEDGAPDEKSSREVTVVPIGDEAGLYYREWVKGNLEKVTKATGGKVGYLHIPDMGVDGLNEFVKAFYPQLRKKALIIDVRGNGGGNVSPMVIERLRRKLVFHDMARNVASGTDPTQTFLGPLVCLMDEFSASDGDIFPYRFKYHRLGPLIGKRSWGGVVGIRGSLPLIDGGSLHKPEFAIYSADGKAWVIEGHGVDPDIVVDNDPAKEFAGEDQQLDRGVQEALRLLETEGREILPKPPFPKKR